MIIGVDGNEANVERRVGSNQYAFELLHALHDLPESKKHQWIVYLRSSPLPDMPQLATWWKYKVFGPKHFWTQIALPISLVASRQKLDVFFTPGHYRPRWSPVPTVVSIMDLGYLRFPEQFKKRDLVQLKNWTSRSIKKASQILTISQATKEDIIHFYKIPESKITVTYPGYDKKKFHARVKINKEILKNYTVTEDYILYIGTLKPNKNIEGIIEAYATLANNSEFKRMYADRIKLVVAGKKGWLYKAIFEKVRELGLGKRVVFTDYVDEEDKPTLLAGARVLVNPSFWEGFGINLVEAMAVGTPVVASNIASLPEVVGSAGVLVNPNDPKDIAEGLRKALTYREVYTKRGIDRAKEFSWQETAKQTLEVLGKAAGNHVQSKDTSKV